MSKQDKEEFEVLSDKFWFITIQTTLKKLSPKRKKDMKRKDYEVIKTLYEKHGADWQKLAEGDLDEWQTLRSACKVYLKSTKDQNGS